MYCENNVLLQILTSLEIWIPQNILMNMFKVGVHSLANPDPNAETQAPLQTSAPAHVMDSLPLGK